MSIEVLYSREVYLPLLTAVGTYVGLWLIKNIGIVRLRKISATTDTYVDDLILNVLGVTRHYFMIGVSLYAGVQFIKIDPHYAKWDERIFVVLFALQAISWAKEAVASWVGFTVERKNNDPSVKTTMDFIGLILKFLIIAGILLFALNNLGVNVSTFIAGLGVGGVAIALATQNILGDLFSSLSIVLDKPFVIGDFIIVNDWMGTVEHVGLKTTRIRSLAGEQIVVSNSNLLSAKISNFKRMQERRVVFRLGVTYSTKRENLKKAPRLIEEVIKKYENTRYDRSHFLNYGAYSLDIDTVYFVLSPDFNVYADLHEKILLDIHEAFEANDLEFAFPTQTLHVEKVES
ncbi:MAG: mechanosensitive ion channel family protein [Bacteriovoracia bacterium]